MREPSKQPEENEPQQDEEKPSRTVAKKRGAKMMLCYRSVAHPKKCSGVCVDEGIDQHWEGCFHGHRQQIRLGKGLPRTWRINY